MTKCAFKMSLESGWGFVEEGRVVLVVLNLVLDLESQLEFKVLLLKGEFFFG